MDLETHTLTSSCGEISRTVWLLPPTRKPQRIGIFLDGEHYLEHMDAQRVLGDLTDGGRVASTACLFISNQSAESRHQDYICNETYRRYLTRDVLPWISKRHPCGENEDHLIAGTSLSGLQAAYVALLHPLVFRRTLCQSGSFWWNDEWLTRQVESNSGPRGKFWLSVGTKEKGAGMSHPPSGMLQTIDQDVAIRHFRTALEQHGHRVHHHLYQGGHESANWKNELPDALAWLLQEEV